MIINNAFYCSDKCMTSYAIDQSTKLRAKRERADIRKEKERIKTKADYLRDAQQAFNAFIRERDMGLPCISCGTTKPGIQYAAGHYKTCGGSPELRFDEKNVHRQCNQYCNMQLSGNLLEYRKGLIERYGMEIVDYLESYHEPKNYTIDDIKEITKKYRAKTRELKKQKVA